MAVKPESVEVVTGPHGSGMSRDLETLVESFSRILGHCMYNITKLTHHFIYQWGNLLMNWCGIRCQADMGVGCMVIGVSHINVGIAFVPLSTTLANCWIVKFSCGH